MRIVKEDGMDIVDGDGRGIFSIRERFEGETLLFYLAGSIPLGVSYAFEDELTAALTVCSRIVIDFSGLCMISSAGLKALLCAQQILDKRKDSFLRLKNLRPEVFEVFKSLGFEDLFEIEN